MQLSVRGLGTNGPAPLGSVGVPLDPGVVALYGRNGAGKTRMLKALHEVLDGEKPGWATVDMAPDVLAEALEAEQQQWIKDRDLGPLDPTSDLPWRAAGRATLDRVLGDMLLERWVHSGSGLLWQVPSEALVRPSALVDEVVLNHDLMLHIHGGKANLEVSVILGPQTPNLRLVAADMLGRLQTFDALSPKPDRSTDEFQEWTMEWEDWVSESFHANDFFTVFGSLPLHATDRWQIRTGQSGWTSANYDPDVFREELEWLASPSTRRVVLTGVEPGTSLVEGVDWSPQIALTDDRISDPDSLVERTREAIATWGAYEGTRLASPPDEIVLGWAAPLNLTDTNDGSTTATWVVDLATHLAEESTHLLRDLLPGAPLLECGILPPSDWFLGRSIRWTAIDPTGSEVELEDLSDAQYRTAMLAISLVLAAFTSGFQAQLDEVNGLSSLFGEMQPRQEATGFTLSPVDGAPSRSSPIVLLLDEPEAGLHVAAEDHLVGALHAYGVRNDITIVIATHSRAALKNSDVTLVQVYRGERGYTATRTVEFPQDSPAEVLGVDRADLLQLIDTIVLVEGRHDEVVLEELIGPELKRRRCKIVPLRGAKGLKHAADLELIAGTLDVPVLVLLDNLRADAISELWDDLCDLGPDSSGAAVDELIACHLGSDRSDEENQAVSLMRALLRHQRHETMSVFGLSKPDVLDYLPVERLVPDASSWSALRSDYEAQLAVENRVRQFKRWLELKRRGDFGDDAIRIACASLEAVPDEFLHLLARLDSIQERFHR